MEQCLESKAEHIVIMVLQFVMLIPWFIAVLGDETMRRVLPKINNYAKRGIYDFGVKLQKTRKIKNMGDTPVVPDVDDAVFKKFVRDLWREVDGTDDINGVELTEAIRLPKFSGSRKQFVACMERLRAARITTVEGKKNVRKWRIVDGSYDSARRKLGALAKGR